MYFRNVSAINDKMRKNDKNDYRAYLLYVVFPSIFLAIFYFV